MRSPDPARRIREPGGGRLPVAGGSPGGGRQSARGPRRSPSLPGALARSRNATGALFRDVIDRWEGQLDQAVRRSTSSRDGLPDPDAEAIRRVLYGPDSPCEVPDESIVNVEGYFPSDGHHGPLEVAGRGRSLADPLGGGAALRVDPDGSRDDGRDARPASREPGQSGRGRPPTLPPGPRRSRSAPRSAKAAGGSNWRGPSRIATTR